MRLSRRHWILTASVSAILLVIGAVRFDRYARAPATFDLAPLQVDPHVTELILILHGSAGRDEPTLIALEARARELVGMRPGVAILRYIWSPHSDDRFRAAANGDRVGRLLGAELARLPGLQALHMISHSAGAYIPGPLCETLRGAVTRPVRVDITYLDPMGIRGAFDFSWGARSFGSCGDYVQAFINADDPVPGTNSMLEQAWNVDVTEAPGKDGYERGGHRWPAQYYLDNVDAAEILPGGHDHAAQPRGAVVRR